MANADLPLILRKQRYILVTHSKLAARNCTKFRDNVRPRTGFGPIRCAGSG